MVEAPGLVGPELPVGAEAAVEPEKAVEAEPLVEPEPPVEPKPTEVTGFGPVSVSRHAGHS